MSPVASSRQDVTTGVAVGVAANLTWGLAFLVPVLLAAFDPVVITLGRYLAYGTVSLLLLAVGAQKLRGHGWGMWRTAALFALTGNVGYYFFLVQGIALVGAPVVVVIIGTMPVTVALYGNWRRREFPFSRLALPLGLIVTGLVVVNAVEVDWSGVGQGGLTAQVGGILCALTAVGLWTWYGVSNATFLKAHPEVSPGQWTTAIGVMTFVMALVASPALLVGLPYQSSPAPGGLGASVWWLVAGSLLLGVVVSWGGTLLWNRASHLLPVSVAGQLIVFETLSGLSYVFLATWRLPPPLEVGGVVIVITGVLIGIRRSMRSGPVAPAMAPGAS
jgi:drug/metabolite transporter (DMT)-like permease